MYFCYIATLWGTLRPVHTKNDIYKDYNYISAHTNTYSSRKFSVHVLGFGTPVYMMNTAL